MNINDIETKVDSAEKLAAVAGIPTNEVLFAPEINAIVEALRTVDNRQPKQVVLYNMCGNSGDFGGNTAPNIVWTYFAPANSLPTKCSLQFFVKAIAVGQRVNDQFSQIYVSQSENDLGLQIGNSALKDAGAFKTNPLKRNLTIADGFLYHEVNPYSSHFPTDEIYWNNQFQTAFAFDVTVDNWFHFAIQQRDDRDYGQLTHAQIILTPQKQ